MKKLIIFCEHLSASDDFLNMPTEFEAYALRPAVSGGGVRKVRASALVGGPHHAAAAARAGPSMQQQVRDSSRMGSWSAAQKLELVRLVREHNPCGAADWEVGFKAYFALSAGCCLGCPMSAKARAACMLANASLPQPFLLHAIQKQKIAFLKSCAGSLHGMLCFCWHAQVFNRVKRGTLHADVAHVLTRRVQAIAEKLGRWSRGGASAERMYRTLTDPGYQKATNKHGRRLNKRSGTPMHIMAAHALQQLPGKEGNLTQVLCAAAACCRPCPCHQAR